MTSVKGLSLLGYPSRMSVGASTNFPSFGRNSSDVKIHDFNPGIEQSLFWTSITPGDWVSVDLSERSWKFATFT